MNLLAVTKITPTNTSYKTTIPKELFGEDGEFRRVKWKKDSKDRIVIELLEE